MHEVGLDSFHETGEKVDTTSQFETETTNSDKENTASRLGVKVGNVTCWKNVSSFKSFGEITWSWLVLNRAQYLSGITVALAQIPEAVSFSFVAGVDPIVGLQSAWIMGICTSIFGGRPGMVAGSTGAGRFLILHFHPHFINIFNNISSPISSNFFHLFVKVAVVLPSIVKNNGVGFSPSGCIQI